MPVIFVGHGSPMNAIEDNRFSQGWRQIADMIPKPKAILSVSAHWLTRGTKVLTVPNPKTIHDFYGFPPELYAVEYPAPGNPQLAEEALTLLGEAANADTGWGLDHGTWSVLRVMYPDAGIPVFQVSLDRLATEQEHFDIGARLKLLRERDVLIMGSGNVVHNLGILDFSLDGGFDWAYEFDDFITGRIIEKNYADILQYRNLNAAAGLAVPTTEHFDPLFYVLGAVDETDTVTVHNKACMAGSVSMTTYIFA
ncbi:MAG TPA: 4,5-DOPA dioxygenase extradiol [Firmicutes bacterium]|nr:4,5-DOPA dioxygenase extradiol [Bacillota bacterium]